MIITRTPLRISFFGGGTDYPAWYRDEGGAVLATTIDKYCYISCRYQPPVFLSRYRIAYRNIELCAAIEEIKHPSVRACLGYTGIKEGLEIVYTGDLPARTGLGSSSSFTVGMLNALFSLQGQRVAKTDLANHAIEVEQNILKEPVGSQDQIMAAHGGLKLISFGKSVTVEPVVLDPARLDELQNHLMLFYSGVSRFGSEIARDKIDHIPQRRSELRSIRALVYESLEALASNRPMSEFGRLLHESWLLKRTLSDKVSTPQVEDIYRRALANGAVGGKLLGAGGGGFLLFLVAPENRKQLKAALRPVFHVPFAFESSGSQVIHFENNRKPAAEDGDWEQALEMFPEAVRRSAAG